MVIEKRPPFAPPSFFRILQGLATCALERERERKRERAMASANKSDNRGGSWRGAL